MFSILNFNKLALIALIITMSCGILFGQDYLSDIHRHIEGTYPPNSETTTRPAFTFRNGKWGPNTDPTYIPRATLATREFLECFTKCPATSEYQPVCATNREQYYNIGKFQCARQCGQDIQIVRNSSCPRLL